MEDDDEDDDDMDLDRIAASQMHEEQDCDGTNVLPGVLVFFQEKMNKELLNATDLQLLTVHYYQLLHR